MNIKSRLEAEEAEAERLIQYLSQGAANQELPDDGNTQEQTSALQEVQNTENKPSALQEIEEEKQTEVVEQKEIVSEDIAENSEKDPAKNDAYWENKFKILQGKYDAELPRERTLTKIERTKNERLTVNLQEVQAALREERERADYAEAELLKVKASNDDTAGYEPELFQAIRNDVAKEFGLEKAKVKAQAKKPDLQQASVITEDEAMNAIYDLTGGKEKWNSIDKNPQFISWLKEVDRFTGEPRQTTMVRAFQNEKFDTAAEYYLEFDRLLQKESSLDAVAKKRQLGSMTSPKSKGDSSPSVEQKVEFVTGKEMEKFSDDCIAGRITDPDLIERTKARFDRAIADGRVKP
ncbi:MAG: hypothetical protein V4629_03090 [Pseudomonadota bacterium]